MEQAMRLDGFCRKGAKIGGRSTSYSLVDPHLTTDN